MKRPVIYLDMDGVIADFIEALLWYHNRGDLVDSYEGGIFPKDWNLEGLLGTEEEIWAPVLKGKEHFWAESINPYDWKDEVIQEVQMTGIDWYICTTPYFNPESYSGKIKWLNKHVLPKVGKYKTIMMKDKWLLAHENAVLVDDNERNCQKFADAGGRAFLFPQPWNRMRNTMKARISLLHAFLQKWSFPLQEKAEVVNA